MQIEIQSTPNPNAHKFVLPDKVFASPLSFATADAAASHPLAKRLFALGTIYNVFMVQNFITINKLPDAEWASLDEAATTIIADYFD